MIIMNNKKICFISCVNDDKQYEECLLYISNLNIPKGYEIDTISIKEANSMAQGYNEAIKHTDAKYKVYLHQDTFIINKNFIFDILKVFECDNEIGMIGMVGARTMPLNGVWWDSKEIYGQVYGNSSIEMKNLCFKDIKGIFEEVKVIDGLIMITSKDVKWREDLFDGWHYYDMSQSLEFIKNGFKVVVPNQINPWCLYDYNLVNINNGYEKYREIYLKEYIESESESLHIYNKKENENNYIGKVLITNNYLVNLSGSEIVALNIANSFIEKGYEVVMATFSYGYPLKGIIEERGIKVLLLNDNNLNNCNFDIIWAQHFTTLNCILFDKNIKANKIINNIMSPFEPLESPSVYSDHISLNVVNSLETKRKIIDEGVNEEKIFVMPNPVEKEFINNYVTKKNKILKKICVVSNHVPTEIYLAVEKLRNQGFVVDIYGMRDTYVYINAEILNKYDAIITIGKTVQYGISLGIPIFCYDRFGGPGWLNRENIKKAFEFNFSGRCSNLKLSYEEISKEIVYGYKKSFDDINFIKELLGEEFDLIKKLDYILKIIEDKKNVDIEFIKEKYSMINRQNRLNF